MPSFNSKDFGPITYDSSSVIEFPNGLPGFEERRRFLAVTFPHTRPLVFLQSLEDAALCFITLPVLAIDQQYRLQISDEDLKSMGLAQKREVQIGKDVACLAILTLQQSSTTANLLAPVVINLGNLRAVQAIAPEFHYSHQHVLSRAQAVACS